MELHEIDALLRDTSTRLGIDPPPVTPEALPQASTVANRSNQQKAESYFGEVRDYLSKIRRGRSVRGVDPTQPALSHAAETVRQADMVNRANRFESRMR